MSRGYVIEDREGESELARQVREETVKRLADQWSELDHLADRAASLREVDEDAYLDAKANARDEARNDGADARDAALAAGKTPEEAKAAYKAAYQERMDAFDQEVEEHDSKPFRRMEAIEAVLADLGARMMRPYEHWGECERQIEWLENRYDYGE